MVFGEFFGKIQEMPGFSRALTEAPSRPKRFGPPAAPQGRRAEPAEHRPSSVILSPKRGEESFAPDCPAPKQLLPSAAPQGCRPEAFERILR